VITNILNSVTHNIDIITDNYKFGFFKGFNGKMMIQFESSGLNIIDLFYEFPIYQITKYLKENNMYDSFLNELLVYRIELL
jgi:hypothetical protein